MAIKLISPRFSFVRFYPGYYPDDNTAKNNRSQIANFEYGLPIINRPDYAFEIIVKTDDSTDNATVATWDASNMLLFIVPGLNNTVPGSFITNIMTGFTIETIDLHTYILRWSMGINFSAATLVGERNFQLLFHAPGNSGTSIDYLSNPFSIIKDDGFHNFTTVIRYRSDIDQYGFYYCGDNTFHNIARVRFYLASPEYVEDEAVYVKSNGGRIVTKDVTYKRLLGTTDYMPEWQHDCLMFALKHSDVTVGLPGYFVRRSRWATDGSDDNEISIRKDGEYKVIPVDNGIYPHYQAQFKVFETNFFEKQDVCGECGSGGAKKGAYFSKSSTLDYGLSAISAKFTDVTGYAISDINEDIVDSASISDSSRLSIIIKSSPIVTNNVNYDLLTVTITYDGGKTTTVTISATYES